MRIVLADERHKVRFALRTLLQQQTGMEVVGEAATGHELMALIEQEGPDLVLADCELPGVELPALVQGLRTARPETMIVALSGRVDARQRAYQAGVDAFVSKADPPERLLCAIEGCACGCPGG